MTTILDVFLETDKITDDRTIVSISDLHLTRDDYNNRGIGFKNVLELIDTLDNIDFDYLLVPGDIINDTRDLENYIFFNNLKFVLKELTRDKLSFFSLGEHDLMTRDTKVITKNMDGWIEGDNYLLKKLLHDLPNTILLDNFDSFSLNDDALLESDFSKSNINIVGVSMPYDYYKVDNETDVRFWNYFSKFRAIRGTDYTKLDENKFNILMLHSLKNYIKMSRNCGYNLYPNVDFLMGGHYHNGGFPNWMKSSSDELSGIVKVNDIYAHVGGYTNFNVEKPIINSLMGGPYVLVLHLLAVEKGKECGVVRVKKYLK